MTDTAVHAALLDLPRAATIWLVLIALALVAVAGLLARPSRGKVEDDLRIREAARRRARLAADARDLSRYAEEVAVAADRAAATARRHRDEWLKAEGEAGAAWAAFDRAEAAARRLAAAGAFPSPRTARTPAEYADRERYLRRAVTDACWTGDLSILDLSDALAHRGGWDPRRHPVDQEALLSRVVRDRAWAAHQRAAASERAAWDVAQLSAASADSLRCEAAEAAERARHLRPFVAPIPEPLAGPAAERLTERRDPRLPARLALGLRTKSRWA